MATLSLYETTFGTSIHALETLLDLLEKAKAHPEASTIPEARIYPDMRPFSFQIRIVTAFSKKFIETLTSRTVEQDENEPKTLDGLVELVTKTLDLVKSVPRDEVDGTSITTTTIKSGSLPPIDVTVQQFVLTYALPNIYFHLVTAYDILRLKGFDIGKRNYLKNFASEYYKPQ
ncbi:hypothetical protein VTI28DRAFT_6178 [Corynascus sepedonium]